MSEPNGCSNCGGDTDNEPLVLCDECGASPSGATPGQANELIATIKDLIHGFEGKRRLNDGDRLRLANARDVLRKFEGHS